MGVGKALQTEAKTEGGCSGEPGLQQVWSPLLLVLGGLGQVSQLLAIASRDKKKVKWRTPQGFVGGFPPSLPMEVLVSYCPE